MREDEARSPAANATLEGRVREHWVARRWGRSGDRVAVACSGGLDSLVLLHLFRFPLADLGLGMEVAHFDHRMRPESASEVEWLRGLSRAWQVPLRVGIAPSVATSEASARRLRYDFLEGLIGKGGATWVLTAHHADDQVETVLFRILRGTGIEGLRGIPEQRDPGILRPLLPFRRSELEAYARRHHLRPRVDVTNEAERFARNRIRRQLLPLLEEVHPGAHAGLIRLAENASDTHRALDTLLATRLEEIAAPGSGGAIVLRRSRFLEEAPAVQVQLFRSMAHALGFSPSRAGTAAALEFMRGGASGAAVSLQGGLGIRRDFDDLRILSVDPGASEDEWGHPLGEGATELRVPSSSPGRGEFSVGGRRYEARWGDATTFGPGGDSIRLVSAEIRFPLTFRGWKPGDRTRTEGGGKKLSKLFGELRIPRAERGRLPILVDAENEVIWIPWRHRIPGSGHPATEPREDEPGWTVGVRDADEP